MKEESHSLSLERCGKRKQKLEVEDEEGHSLSLSLKKKQKLEDEGEEGHSLSLERCGNRKQKLEEALPIPTPCLLFPTSSAQQQQLLLYNNICSDNNNNNNNNNYCYLSIPELELELEQGMQIRASNHGWLLLQHLQHLLLFNPVSQHQIKLPPLDPDPHSNYDYTLYTFTLPLLKSDVGWTCAVLLSRMGIAMYCHPHDPNWARSNRFLLTDADADADADDDDATFHSGVECIRVAQGFHLSDMVFVLAHVTSPLPFLLSYAGMLDLSHHHLDGDYYLNLTPIQELPTIFHPHYSSIVMSFDETLFVVTIVFNYSYPDSIIALHLRYWDMDACEWVKLTTLNDRNLFVGNNNCSTSCPLFPGQQQGQGRVYFYINQDLYFYLPQDNTLTPLLPQTQTSQFGIPFWFHPHIHTTTLLKSDADDSSSQRPPKKTRSTIAVVEASNPFLCLPISLMEFLVTYLEWFDYLSFRATCKTFRSVAPPQVLQSCRSVSFPFLMTHRYHGDSTVLDCFSITDPCRNESYFISIRESCVGQKLFAFKDGWLLLSDHGNMDIKFYNPFTRDDIGISNSGGLFYFNCGGFSTSPTLLSKCLLAGILAWEKGDDEIGIGFRDMESDLWNCIIRFSMTGEQLKFEPSGNPCVYHDGAFYFLDVVGYLGVVRLTGREPEFTWDVYDKPKVLIDPPYYGAHLVECGGELLSIFIGKLGKWVQVFRLNQANMDWIKVDNLRDEYSLFVSTLSSFAVTTWDQPGTGDRIYLPRLRGETGVIYYSLKSGKYHSLRNMDSMENFCGTRELLGSFWVDPKCAFKC